MTGISLTKPLQLALAVRNNFQAHKATSASSSSTSDYPNPIYDLMEGDGPLDWAENIFLALYENSDEEPDIQDIQTGNNDNTSNFSYQSTGEGHNQFTGTGEDSTAVQYNGKGNNNANGVHLFQLTEEGDNTGTGTELMQYTTKGKNTATGNTSGSMMLQYNEEGDNEAKGETISQFTNLGNNLAEGKSIDQSTAEGTNTATGRGEGAIVQKNESGDNVATNSQYISQAAGDGANTATGTDQADTIIQQGGGTANGGKGNDQFFVQQYEAGSGDYTFTVNGGEGEDTVNLYGDEEDWEQEKLSNGQVVYTHNSTGDKVTLTDFTEGEDEVQFGTEAPLPPQTEFFDIPGQREIGETSQEETDETDTQGRGTFG